MFAFRSDWRARARSLSYLQPLKRSVVAAGALGIVLSGCSGSALLPPAVPSGSELADYYHSDFSLYNQVGNLSSRDAMIVGLSYVDEKCSNFFDAVEETHRQSTVLKSGIATTATQAATLMKIAKSSTMAVASVAATVEITKVLLEQYDREFTFAPHAVELRALVQASMNAQRRELGALVEGNRVHSMVEVTSAVKKYAENCTLAAIREKWNQAISKAVAEGVKPEAGGSPRDALPAPEDDGAAESSRVPARGTGGILGVRKYVVR